MHVPLPAYETENVASMYPFAGRKKSCTPRLACSLLSDVGLVGLSHTSPRAVEVKVRVASFTYTVELTVSPELGRSGAT